MDTTISQYDLDRLADLCMDDDYHREELDAWFERNRAALSASLDRAYEDIDAGRVSTLSIEDIIARGRERHNMRHNA
jgi:hypothetical protein